MAQDDQVQTTELVTHTPVDAAPPAATTGALDASEREELNQLRAARTAQMSELQPTAAPEVQAVVEPEPEVAAEEDDDELPYGTHACPECGAIVGVQYPGYVDPDVRGREAICSNGHRFFPVGKTRVHSSE